MSWFRSDINVSNNVSNPLKHKSTEESKGTQDRDLRNRVRISIDCKIKDLFRVKLFASSAQEEPLWHQSCV